MFWRGRGKKKPFEHMLTLEQKWVLHHDGELKSETRGLGYQASVHMVAIQEGSSSEKYPKSRELIEEKLSLLPRN